VHYRCLGCPSPATGPVADHAAGAPGRQGRGHLSSACTHVNICDLYFF
jgi:hypothetical protein